MPEVFYFSRLVIFLKPVHILISGGGPLEKILSARLMRVFEKSPADINKIQEIRLRSGQPLIVRYQGGERMIDEKGNFCLSAGEAFRVSAEDIQESLAYICQYSLYAYEDKIRSGFITIRGGHRVGVAGQVVIENGKIQSITHISSLNIRISHQIKGCGEKYFSFLWDKGRPCHTLIVSPPGAGKTTLLRDFIRLFSDSFENYPGMSVGLIDERSEVGASYMGIPQNDVGIRTDVLDSCPKAEGIGLMVRSMAPRIIAFDELGGGEDVEAVRYAAYSGCTVLTTVHGQNMEDVRKRLRLESESIFYRYLFLKGEGPPGHVRAVVDEKNRALFEET